MTHFIAQGQSLSMDSSHHMSAIHIVAVAIVWTLTVSTVYTHDEDLRVVCYVGTWSVYRPGRGSFDMSHIDAQLCTHFVYAFVGLDNETDTIMSIAEHRDFTKGGFREFIDLKNKNPHVKVLVAIGGWNEGSTKYSKMAATKESRDAFVKSAVEFVRNHHFDGLDLDWEYPGHIERGGKIEDKGNLNLLVKELKAAMPQSSLLTMAIGVNVNVINNGYDLKSLSRDVDFFNVMCYDYHGNWEKTAGHNSPLYHRPEENIVEQTLNMNYTVNYLMSLGVPRNKLVVGMPMYGHTFVLENPNANTPASPTKIGEGESGPFTSQAGFMGYNELCGFNENNGWTYRRDQYHKVPYMYRNYTWISYDDPESLFLKARFVLDHHFGGAMIWSLDTDDFLATCSKMKFPLMDAILKGLGKRPSTPDLEPTTTPKTPSSGVDGKISFHFALLLSVLSIIMFLG